ncbi:uncharacterized protein LOC136092426 [Hydra vulgaris]|uniref:Uncharacterized protein LOC136092426 n=1 Tax=Hydra vulgaris TaxID=6087 RepID=A0ABM4DQ77_HYDVU
MSGQFAEQDVLLILIDMTILNSTTVRHELTGDYLCDFTEQMLTELLPLIKDKIRFIRLLKTTKQSVSAALDNSESTYTVTVVSVNNEKGETTNSGSFSKIEEAECVHSQMQEFPFVYQLPLFLGNIIAKLQCQDKASFGLGSKSKALLIDSLFDDLKRRDILYPTRRIYSAVSSAVILKFFG